MTQCYDDIVVLAEKLRYCELATFWYSLILMSKFFHAFEGHPKLGVITETLRRGVVDITHFMIVFSLVFINFTLGAYFIYGNQLYDWSNMWLALNSSFRTLMGDFDFASMYAISPIPAMVWFWLYMVLFYLIMLNMLLAIVMDTYAEVKSEVEEEFPELFDDDPDTFPTAIEKTAWPPPPLLPGEVDLEEKPQTVEKVLAMAARCEEMFSQVNDRLARLEDQQELAATTPRKDGKSSVATARELRNAGAAWREGVRQGREL
jgi:hypothetical protein